MPEGNDLAVFHSRTPLNDFIHRQPRLFSHTNVGWGEGGLMSLVEPGAMQARRRLNSIPDVSLRYNCEWGGSSDTAARRDIAPLQRHLAALSFRNRTSSVRATQVQAAAPLALAIRK
ncbi:MAG: hypothetical protein PHV13_03865 [Candidatus ainarchaeum sp.]|nr:hypothetical protein [Candidatus ainarchaeum sp.]